MADGGQRLLDVIDDPNALESFLGGLTADSELLPSAESVDNVVASLARSLEGDYEVDSPMSPNETLFDTLESSSNNLTDISQSYVPSDFENVNISNSGGQGGNNNYGMGSMSNGEVTHLQQQQSLQNSLSNVVQSGVVEQYLMSSNQQTITTNENSSSSSSVSSSIQQQFTSNCDSSSTVTTSSTSTTQYIQQQQQQQIQINQNQIVLQNNNNSNATYIFNNQQKTQQMTSLSTSSVDGQQPSNNDSLNNMISISLSNNHNNSSTSSSNSEGGQGIMTNAFQQQEISQQQGHIQVINHGQQQTSNSNLNVISVNTTNNNNNNTVSSTTANSVNITSNNSTSSIQQQQFQVANTVPQQATTTLNHLVSAGQTVSLGNVGGAQIIATSSGNIVTTGQGQANIIQQIQSASGGQSYITMEQPTTALIAGPGAFGGTNLLVTGAPTYAVVPTGAQFLSNAIMTQPQAIQTLTKGPNGTYYQTTGGTQIVTASNVNSLQNVANSNAGKPKQPPQLLPKPQSNGGTNNTSGASTDSISSSSVTSTNTTQASGTVSTPTEGVVTQIFQQQQQIQGLQNPVVVTSMSNSGVTIQQQPSFTIGSTGLGQVVVSQNPTQQTQLTGTIVVNQYGQPMLLPSANAGQGGGLQFILRQQPTQPQVLTFQTPSGTATIGAQNANQGKSIVRYVPQMPQVAQSGGYGLQQIQTANGPAWVAVRYPQQTATTISAQHGQFSQIQTETVVPAQIQQQQQQVQVQVQTTQPQPVQQQQIIQPQPITPVTQPAPQPIVQQNPQKHQRSQDTTPDSSEPPPAKKPKAKAKSNKKKVTLDLEQLLKQSGIMDEDLEDDSSFDFSFSSQDAQHNGYGSPVVQEQNVVPVLQQSPVQHPAVNTSGKNKNGSTTTPKKPPAKSRSRKKPPAKPPTPPPPPPPTPKSGKGSKKKGGGNPKAEIKTDNSNKNNSKAPKKLSSIDDVSATIAAVAAAANSPSPPSSPAPTPSPASSLPLTPLTPRSITPSITPNPIPIQTQVQQAPYAPPISNSNGMNNPGPGPSSIASTTRIVQTIQLTPQNQQLLRNIQAQISRLLSLPKRNETEQTALQKLITLQQQVIATGVPVPNPTHLNNENTTASLVVASSTFSSGTSTTNSMGQHHLQSFPTNYRSALEDKKAEEQRIVTQKAEEEKRARWKKEEFEMLLKRDQQCVVKPDYEIPFNSKRDAVERLMKYHILRDRNDMNFEEFDYEFGEKASLLLDKFNGMIAKHRSLLLKESMKEVGCAERVMLERMFVGEEKLKLEQDRQTVSQGEVLDLAPPPASWVPRIQEMVDKEMKEMERDSFVNQQVQSAIDSIIGFGADDAANYLPDEGEKVEYDAFGVPINQSYNNGMNSSSADIDEAVRSILS